MAILGCRLQQLLVFPFYYTERFVMNKLKVTRRILTPILGSLGLLLSNISVFAAMDPPPLPLGSAQVKIEAGQSPVEQKRMLNAHKHHTLEHHKKDMTRDDTMDVKHDPKLNKGKKDSDSPSMRDRVAR